MRFSYEIFFIHLETLSLQTNTFAWKLFFVIIRVKLIFKEKKKHSKITQTKFDKKVADKCQN